MLRISEALHRAAARRDEPKEPPHSAPDKDRAVALAREMLSRYRPPAADEVRLLAREFLTALLLPGGMTMWEGYVESLTLRVGKSIDCVAATLEAEEKVAEDAAAGLAALTKTPGRKPPGWELRHLGDGRYAVTHDGVVTFVSYDEARTRAVLATHVRPLRV